MEPRVAPGSYPVRITLARARQGGGEIPGVASLHDSGEHWSQRARDTQAAHDWQATAAPCGSSLTSASSASTGPTRVGSSPRARRQEPPQ